MSNTDANIKTIYLVDADIDGNESLFKKLVTSSKDAFSRPSIVCKLIDQVPDDHEINVVINTRGGALANCEKILKKLLQHKSGYKVFIRNECYSAGAIIALGAKEIVMADDSYIGKIDPQNGGSTTPQLIIHATTDEKYIKSTNIYQITEARYVMNYMDQIVNLIFDKDSKIRENIMSHLVYSELPHEALFDYDQCKDTIGLNVRRPTDDEKHYFSRDVTIIDYQKVAKTNYSYFSLLKLVVVVGAIGYTASYLRSYFFM
jgi:hypothetical protein